jgi:hypothetical protein
MLREIINPNIFRSIQMRMFYSLLYKSLEAFNRSKRLHLRVIIILKCILMVYYTKVQ